MSWATNIIARFSARHDECLPMALGFPLLFCLASSMTWSFFCAALLLHTSQRTRAEFASLRNPHIRATKNNVPNDMLATGDCHNPGHLSNIEIIDVNALSESSAHGSRSSVVFTDRRGGIRLTANLASTLIPSEGSTDSLRTRFVRRCDSSRAVMTFADQCQRSICDLNILLRLLGVEEFRSPQRQQRQLKHRSLAATIVNLAKKVEVLRSTLTPRLRSKK